jgi:predicted enzyme related to lactoylglutathione lyase
MHQQQQSACSQAEHHHSDSAAELGNYCHLLRRDSPTMPLKHSAGNPIRQSLYAMVLCTAGAAATQAAPSAVVVLPALTQPASGEHHVGKVIWADLVTPDVDAAKRFYGALFGWTFRDVPGDPNYTLALLDGEPLAGLFQKPLSTGQSQQPAWLTFLAVRDVDAVQHAVLQHGGKVLSKPHDYPQRGRQAVLADPDGAVFAVLAAQGGDPSDYVAEPGERIWSSLMVKDPKRETEFYKTLFGYDVYDLASDGESEGQHYVLSGDSYARVGLNALPADSKRRHAHWLNFVRVANAAEAAKKVVVLGGRVLVEPRMDRHGGQLAVVADPSGAPFGLMEWSDSDTNQEPR